MRPSEAYGVVLRTIGLMVFLWAVLMAFGAIAVRNAMSRMPDVGFGAAGGMGMMWTGVVPAVIGILVGLYLMRGAPLLVRFGYPKDDARP